MKLALVLPGPLDRRSGGYAYDSDWRDHLVGRGHTVDVWSLPGRPGPAKREFEARVTAGTADLVVFDALVHSLILGLLERLNHRKTCPWVALVHHLAWLEDPEPTRRTPGLQDQERRFLGLMDAFLFTSDDTCRSVSALRGTGADFRPWLVCRPPVALPQVPPSRPPSGMTELLFLGNLTPRKNLHGLLKALGAVRRRRPDLAWRLTVAGNPAFDAAYTRRCRAVARGQGLSDRIVWAGRLEPADLEALWARTDLLAVPSFHEGWGMVYAEALVRGVVPLAADRGGGAEAVGSAGIQVEPRSVPAMAEALEAFLGSTDRDESARRARSRGEFLALSGTGFTGLEPFLQGLVEPPAPTPKFDFETYLEAKATIDSRALHLRVLEAAFSGPEAHSVIELGGGTGTMARRLRSWGRLGTQTRYELLDLRPGALERARDLSAGLFARGRFVTRCVDLRDVLEGPAALAPGPDLVIAHAVLDLFDPGPTAQGLARLGARRYWLTHIFDGLTAWEPVLDPELDDALVVAYHRTMDERAEVGGGSSRAGRQWLTALPAAGLPVHDAGSSDWIVRPTAGRYPDEEAVFLHGLLHFFRASLTGRADVDQAGLTWWLARRQAQVQAGEAVFLAHQLDLVAGRY